MLKVSQKNSSSSIDQISSRETALFISESVNTYMSQPLPLVRDKGNYALYISSQMKLYLIIKRKGMDMYFSCLKGEVHPYHMTSFSFVSKAL